MDDSLLLLLLGDGLLVVVKLGALKLVLVDARRRERGDLRTGDGKSGDDCCTPSRPMECALLLKAPRFDFVPKTLLAEKKIGDWIC